MHDVARRSLSTSDVRTLVAVVAAAQMVSWPLAQMAAPGVGLASVPWATALWALVATLLALAHIAWWRRLLTTLVPLLSVTAPVLLGVGGLVTEAGYGASFAHPTVACAIGLLLHRVVVSTRTPWVSLLASCVAYLLGAWRTVALGVPTLSAVGAELAMIVVVPVGAGIVWRALQHGEDAARAVARLEARELERTRQYRTLHDTVLSTLSAMARGTIDLARPEIRQRIIVESDYLRGLITTSTSTAGMQLVGHLGAITRDLSPSGLRVHPSISDVPDQLPPPVVDAIAGGLREALNNVVKHSGRREAWVTIVGEGPKGVRVTVADRGRGFDLSSARRGLGTTQSIAARMAEVGGTGSIDSEPGEGTTVELEWPR